MGARNTTGTTLTVALHSCAGSAEDHGIVNGIVVDSDARAPCDVGESRLSQGRGQSQVWQPPWQREQSFPPKEEPQETQVSDCQRYCCNGGAVCCASRCWHAGLRCYVHCRDWLFGDQMCLLCLGVVCRYVRGVNRVWWMCRCFLSFRHAQMTRCCMSAKNRAARRAILPSSIIPSLAWPMCIRRRGTYSLTSYRTHCPRLKIVYFVRLVTPSISCGSCTVNMKG